MSFWEKTIYVLTHRQRISVSVLTERLSIKDLKCKSLPLFPTCLFYGLILPLVLCDLLLFFSSHLSRALRCVCFMLLMLSWAGLSCFLFCCCVQGGQVLGSICPYLLLLRRYTHPETLTCTLAHTHAHTLTAVRPLLVTIWPWSSAPLYCTFLSCFSLSCYPF